MQMVFFMFCIGVVELDELAVAGVANVFVCCVFVLFFGKTLCVLDKHCFILHVR